MPTPGKKTRRKVNSTRQEWKWGPEENAAFQKLKDALSSPPVLGYANYSEPFELHTDASQVGLGAILYQQQEGTKRVISYASRGLSKSERNYPAHKLEYLALKWAVTEKFKDYLYGSNAFTVYTDNNPLTYVLTSAKLDATGHRWLAALSAFNFDIKYKTGVSNIDADALSRLPGSSPDLVKIKHSSVQAVCNSINGYPLIDCCSYSVAAVDVIDNPIGQDLSDMSVTDWRRAQYEDPTLSFWVTCVRNRRRPVRTEVANTPGHQAMSRIFDNLCLQRGVLCRKVIINDKTIFQNVLPSKFIKHALTGLHDDLGHPGRDRTTSLARDRFYWPNMTADIDNWVKECPRCLQRKKTVHKAPLVNITSSQPLEIVCMDFLSLEKSTSGHEHILVITDHFTRYAIAIPTKNQTARTTAEALFNHFITIYGFPKRLHSDQGTNFEGKVIQHLCSLAGIEKSRTTPYHPMGNGMTERFNRTLLNMLGTLSPEKKIHWKKYVAPLVHAYNCTKHESTGYSPYFLLFGREPRLPVDIMFGLRDQEETTSLPAYVKEMKERLTHAYQRATEAADEARVRQKGNYDLKVRSAVLQPGDRVLVRILAFQGKHKISDKWETDAYIVTDQPNPDIPVFIVENEKDRKLRKTLHRNHLLPIGSIPLNRERPTPAPRSKRKHQSPESIHSNESDDESEDHRIQVTIPPQSTPQELTAPSTVLGGGGNEDKEDENESDTPEDLSRSEGENQDALSDVDDNDIGEETEVDTGTVDNAAENVDQTVNKEPVSTEEFTRPQRPVRNRRPPAWYRSGDYVMTQQVTQPAWKEKVSYIEQLARTGTLNTMSENVINTILSIVSGADTS